MENFMKELTVMIEAMVVVPEGVDKELWIKNFIRSAVADKLVMLDQEGE